jgi:hypothetical protein
MMTEPVTASRAGLLRVRQRPFRLLRRAVADSSVRVADPFGFRIAMIDGASAERAQTP